MSSRAHLVIREAEEDELTIVHALTRAAFAASAQYPNPSSALQETVADLRTSPRVLVLALRDGHYVAATRTGTADGILSFERLAVHPAVAGQGIGSQLLGWLEARAEYTGCHAIETAARSQQPDNRPYYLKRGYRITGYSGRYGIVDIRTHLQKSLSG
ncbi:MAG: GNAT family N-acetyltransferase [Myxococcota bacterium]